MQKKCFLGNTPRKRKTQIAMSQARSLASVAEGTRPVTVARLKFQDRADCHPELDRLVVVVDRSDQVLGVYGSAGEARQAMREGGR
jgi:hypothetical protein